MDSDLKIKSDWIHPINSDDYHMMTSGLMRNSEYNMNARTLEVMIGSHDDKPTAFKNGCQHLRGFPTSMYHRQVNRTCGAIITNRGNKDLGIPPTTKRAEVGRPTGQWRSMYA